MSYLPGVHDATVDTDRIRMHYLEAGAGPPVIMVHGNLSTGRFYEHLLPELAGRYRVIAPDMRGFGDSEPAPLDATRGLADWADDTFALVRALGIDEPPHLVGWSTGGAAIARYAMDHPVASLTFIDPVSPHGYGGTLADGTPCFPDGAGSGGGTANPEVVRRLAAGDASDESPASIRNVMNALYWAPTHREPPEREDMLVAEILKTLIGVENYPGDSVASENWPGMAPGRTGILNAAVPALLRLVRPGPAGPEAAGAVDARRRRPGGGRRLPAGLRHPRRRGRGAGLARPGRVPTANDDHPDPGAPRALRRGRRPGAHRDVRRLRPRPALRRP